MNLILAERDAAVKARDVAVRYMQDALSDLTEMRAERDAAVARAEQWRQMADRLHERAILWLTPNRCLPEDVQALAAYDAAVAERDEP